MIEMKKKLLAVILSVAMLVALLVPVLAISATGNHKLTIGLGTPTLTEKGGKSVVKVPVNITENDGSVYVLRYQVISTSGLVPSSTSKGDFVGMTEDEEEITLGNTVNKDLEIDGNKGFQIVQDAIGGGKLGIAKASGTLIYLFFEAPTAVGSYNFKIIWMDGADDQAKPYDATVGTEVVTYTVECKSHVAGDPVVVKEATCTEPGKKTVSCTVCGKEMSSQTIPALGHDWDDGVVAEGVKCGETADTTFTCKREGCGVTRVEKGAVVEHIMVADEANSKAATCTEKGVEATKCSRVGCTHTVTKEIPALGHDFGGKMEVVTAPTADAEGKYIIHCTRCDEVEEHAIAKLATTVKVESNGKVHYSFETSEAVLPEDISIEASEPKVDAETKKITQSLSFDSAFVDNLEGEVKVSLNVTLNGKYKNFVVTTVNAQGDTVVVDSTLDGNFLVFNADLAGEYSITYEEVPGSPVTGDATNTVVFTVLALIAVAGLVVVGKKRFAL